MSPTQQKDRWLPYVLLAAMFVISGLVVMYYTDVHGRLAGAMAHRPCAHADCSQPRQQPQTTPQQQLQREQQQLQTQPTQAQQVPTQQLQAQETQAQPTQAQQLQAQPTQAQQIQTHQPAASQHPSSAQILANITHVNFTAGAVGFLVYSRDEACSLLARFSGIQLLGDSIMRQVWVAMLEILTGDVVDGHCRPDADENVWHCKGEAGYHNDVNIARHVRDARPELCPALPADVRASMDLGWRKVLRPGADQADIPEEQWHDDMVKPQLLSPAAYAYAQSVPPPDRSAAIRRMRLAAEYEAALQANDTAAAQAAVAQAAELVKAARRAQMVDGLHASIPPQLLQLVAKDQDWSGKLAAAQVQLQQMRNSSEARNDKNAMFIQTTRVRLLDTMVKEVALGQATQLRAERPAPRPPRHCLPRSVQVALLGAAMHYGLPLRQKRFTIPDVAAAYAHLSAVLGGVQARSGPYGVLRTTYLRLHQYNVEAMKETQPPMYAEENEKVIPRIDDAIAAELARLNAAGSPPGWEVLDFRTLTRSAPRQAAWDGVHYRPYVNHRKVQLFLNYLHAVLDEEQAAVEC